ncbi:MAG: hypothetical protein AAGD01_01005 [Acidobacteriota bacterium]
MTIERDLLERIRRGVEGQLPTLDREAGSETGIESRDSLRNGSPKNQSGNQSGNQCAAFSWPQLLEHRLHGGPEPQGFDLALEHLDQCESCWREAIELDPSLLFRRLTAAHYPEPNPAPADPSTMVHDVAVLRRARATEASRHWALGWPPSRRLAAAAALVAAMTFGATVSLQAPSGDDTQATQEAQLMGENSAETSSQVAEIQPPQAPSWQVGSLDIPNPVDELLGTGNNGMGSNATGIGALDEPQILRSPTRGGEPTAPRLGQLQPLAQPAADGFRDLPLLEGTGRPDARVYSSDALSGEDIAVVMVIDSGFDV